MYILNALNFLKFQSAHLDLHFLFRSQLEDSKELLAAKNAALRDLSEEREARAGREQELGLAMVAGVQGLEDVEGLTASCYTLLDLVRGLQGEQGGWDSPATVGHRLVGEL